jgi:hypothetical protein
MRPIVRSGSVLRSVGEDGLVLSMGVRPGPRVRSSEGRVVIGLLLKFGSQNLLSSCSSIRDAHALVYPANAVVNARATL